MKELSWYATVHGLPTSESDFLFLEGFFFFWCFMVHRTRIKDYIYFFLFQLSYFSVSLLPLSFPATLRFSAFLMPPPAVFTWEWLAHKFK